MSIANLEDLGFGFLDKEVAIQKELPGLTVRNHVALKGFELCLRKSCRASVIATVTWSSRSFEGVTVV